MLGINEDDLPGLKDPVIRKEGHQKIELFFSCRKIFNKDLISKSNPQIRIYHYINARRSKLGDTEVVKDNLNPDFTKTFSMDFIFEIKQALSFDVLDVDPSNGKSEVIGTVETTVGDIMGSRNQIAIFDILDKGKKAGKLIVRAEITDGSPVYATIEFHAEKLKNIAGLFSKVNPYYQISRVIGDNTEVRVYLSETVKKSLNPQWTRFIISLQTLCNNDLHRPIRMEVMSNKGSTKKYIAETTFTIDQIQNQGIKEFNLHNPRKKDKSYGKIVLAHYSIIERPTFLEYLRGGVQLNVIVGVDFTQSNGDPKTNSSLHSLKPDGYNDYQKAIAGVCQILLCYDYDKKIALFGFGGKPKNEKEVNHCFSLTEEENNPYVEGLDGIMEVYKGALKNIRLSGPTYFKPLLSKAMALAEEEKNSGDKVYTILLILTDGMIHDMQPTIDGLAGSANLPLSVIIVGVGNEDFGKMKKLDADDEPLYNSRGEKLQRDLVQFVPFNQFHGDRDKLAEEVLAEVPRQFLEYMKMQKREPEPRQQYDFNKLISIQSMKSVDQARLELEKDGSPSNSLLNLLNHEKPSSFQIKPKSIMNGEEGEERKADVEGEKSPRQFAKLKDPDLPKSNEKNQKENGSGSKKIEDDDNVFNDLNEDRNPEE